MLVRLLVGVFLLSAVSGLNGSETCLAVAGADLGGVRISWTAADGSLSASLRPVAALDCPIAREGQFLAVGRSR